MKWILAQIDTWQVAKQEGMSYWKLRRLRRAARRMVTWLNTNRPDTSRDQTLWEDKP